MAGKKKKKTKKNIDGINNLSDMETNEILLNICEKGSEYKKLIYTLLNEDVYTAKNRLNKSELCRILNLKNKDVDKLFNECQKEFLK